MRHGLTDWNVAHKLQGNTDVPLNEIGRQMAKEAREKYREISFDLCYCSPLSRARETAELVLEGRDLSIQADDRLMEIGFGVYEGIENCLQIPDCPVNVFFLHPEQYVTPVEGGESLEDLYRRTGAFLKEVIQPQLALGKDILIVGHGAMNSSIICQMKKIPVEQFWSVGMKHCKLLPVEIEKQEKEKQGADYDK
jgi:probable phosphoglycerate mutase